jgi:hypothetical protein
MLSVSIRRAIPASAVVLAVAVALSGCGGGSSGNGIASKSPTQIVAAMTKALKTVKSVHVAGSIHASGRITLDLTLTSHNGAKGSISQNALSFKLISVGGNVYIFGGKAFLSHFSGKAGAQLFTGKWLEAKATGTFAQLGSLTDLHSLFNQLLISHDTLLKGATKTIRGQKVVGLHDKAQGGTLYVATTGQPYPIQISKGGTQGGTINFTGYNQPVTIKAPKGAINLALLG